MKISSDNVETPKDWNLKNAQEHEWREVN
jgi:hypothetical protein